MQRQQYDKLKESIRRSEQRKVRNVTCSLMLLPLNPNLRTIELIAASFVEQLHLQNKEEYIDY